MINTVVEVHHVIVIPIATHKIDIALTLETETDMKELLLLLLLNLTGQDMTTINAFHVPIVIYTDLHADHHIDKIHAIDINHIPTLEIDNFHSTLPHTDLLLNHDSLDLLDIDHTLN